MERGVVFSGHPCPTPRGGAWHMAYGEGACFQGSTTPIPINSGVPMLSSFWQHWNSCVYAYTLLRRMTKFGLATYMEIGLF